MPVVLAELAAITGNQDYLTTAECFVNTYLFDAAIHNTDILNGEHASDVDHEHRPIRRAPSLRRAPRIEDPHAVPALDLRHVRVSVDDRLAAGKPRQETRLPSSCRPGRVDHGDPCATGLDDPLRRQLAAQRRLVRVSVDTLDPPERP